MNRSISLRSTFVILIITGAAVSAPCAGQETRSATPTAIVVYQKPATIKQVEAVELLVEVEFSGLTAFDESEVLKSFREQHITWPRNQMPEMEALQKAAVVIEKLLHANGYLQATATGVPDSATHSITFVVDQGQRLPINEFRFAGNQVFSADILSAKMSECLSRYKENGPGYSRDILERCQYDLATHLRSLGYLQARFGELQPQVIGKGVQITVPVTEGALYRLGEVKIEGAEAATQEQLRSVLGLAKGDVVDGTKLGKWAYEDLKKLYGNLGYIEYTAEIEPEFRTLKGRSREGVVDLKVTLDEGKRFRIGAIQFVGDNLSQPELRRLFAMNDGDVYSQERFQEGIKKLNEALGLDEQVDADADSEYKVDAEQALVTIVIKVKKSTAQNQ